MLVLRLLFKIMCSVYIADYLLARVMVKSSNQYHYMCLMVK